MDVGNSVISCMICVCLCFHSHTLTKILFTFVAMLQLYHLCHLNQCPRMLHNDCFLYEVCADTYVAQSDITNYVLVMSKLCNLREKEQQNTLMGRVIICNTC